MALNTICRTCCPAPLVLFACLLGFPGVAIIPFGTCVAEAGIVTWTIDATQSSVSLSIPRFIGGNNNFVDTVNQSTSEGPWNLGNTAQMSGTLATDYTDQTSIQFLAGQNAMVGLNSGSYLLNPNAFDGSSFTNASKASASYGYELRESVGAIDFASIYNVAFDIGSPVLSVSQGGAITGANAVTFGIAGTMANDGVPAFFIGQLDPDSITALVTSFGGAKLSNGGQIQSPDPINQPLLRQLTVSEQWSATINLPNQSGGFSPEPMTVTAQIVATAIVPEPSTATMFGSAFAAIGGLRILRRRRRKPS